MHSHPTFPAGSWHWAGSELVPPVPVSLYKGYVGLGSTYHILIKTQRC